MTRVSFAGSPTISKKIVKGTRLGCERKRVQAAEFKRVRTENIDLDPQFFVKECSAQTKATVTVSNQTPEPVSVSYQIKGAINSATIVDPNPLTHTEQPVKVHVVCMLALLSSN